MSYVETATAHGLAAPEIGAIHQTCYACPSQWELTLSDGEAGYVRYRWGRLQVGFGPTLNDAVSAAMNDNNASWRLGNDLDGEVQWAVAYPYVLAALLVYAGQGSRP